VTITHIFFDVHDVLVDTAPLGMVYAANLGRIMAERYGLTPADWTQANHRVTADWYSYYADLNLSGDDGIADMWEGLYRTTRALFRLTGTPEPPKAELTALSRELPGLAARGDVLYPEVPNVLRQLDNAGLVLGVISHALSSHIRGALAPVLPHFKGTIWGADNAERFDKDVQRYQAALLHARVAPQNCLVLDDKPEPIENARRAGMQAIQICRKPPLLPEASVFPDLRPLVEYCLLQAE
jgi:HAD superfamily hydrolase (TIGR01509 family)